MIAFVFPGQGAQRVGMGSALAGEKAIAKATFQEASDVLGFDVAQLCFQGPRERLAETAFSQPAVLTASIAALRVVAEETGLAPDIVAGHSLGEYTALVCSGALAFADALRLVRLRGSLMQEATPAGVGTMAAILGMDAANVEAVCRDAAGGDVLAVANFNAPQETVIAGAAAAVERGVALAKDRGGQAIALRVSAAFHCSLMEPVVAPFRAELAKVTFGATSIPMVSSVDANTLTATTELVDVLARQITSPVRWIATVEHLVASGVTSFVELGVGRTLLNLASKIAPALTPPQLIQVETPPHVARLKTQPPS